MDYIRMLFSTDYVAIFLGVFIIMSASVAIFDIISKFLTLFGKPFKWVKSQDADHEMLLDHEKKIEKLATKHQEDTDKINKEENAIRRDIANLTNMFLDKQIDDMRSEILNFASSLSSGKKYNRESFKNIFKTYDKYEKILKENGWENGLVEESIGYIRETYRDWLKNGKISGEIK